MPASKVDTFGEELNRILRAVQQAKAVADADMPFLVNLETAILERIKQPEQQMMQGMQQQGLIPSPDQNPMGNGALGLPVGGGMGAPPPSMLGAGGVPGVGMGGGPNNADELRRVLQAPGT